MGLSLWQRISMIARCGCLRARPPHPDVSVALRMRGRRPCHSNRSVNGSNGNGGSLQCWRGRAGAGQGGRGACGGGGRPSDCGGDRRFGERLSRDVPGSWRRRLGGTRRPGPAPGRRGWRRSPGAVGREELECASGLLSGLLPSSPRGPALAVPPPRCCVSGSVEPSPPRPGFPRAGR